MIQASPGCGQIVKWASFDRDLVQFDRKSFEEFFAESGADSASKLELSVFIDADQQRVHVFPFACGLGAGVTIICAKWYFV